MTKRAWLVCLLSAFALSAQSCKSDTKSSRDAGARDGGGTAGAVDASTPCKVAGDCNDDVYCNGAEACVAGSCVAGKPVACSDGIACTDDRCSEKKRACESLPPDADGDGHYDAACKDKNGKPFGDDCDDTDPLRFPGNIESCDAANKDEDCDPKTFGNKDSDNDGFYDSRCCNAVSDAKGAKLNCGTDCDDLNASVNPRASEVCDLFDNNCNGQTDEGVSVKMYPDKDHDGHGTKSGAQQVCAGKVGFASSSDDCNDADPEVFTGEFEICDDKDNNCNGKIDEVEDDAPWFVDADKDGFGDATSTPVYSCQRIPGRVLSSNDCDDTKAAVNPAAAELCDAIDNDCSGKKDFKLGLNDFEDDDNDGIADSKCTGGTDCDDTDATTGKGKDEICDLRDNDCDGLIDEDTAQTVWYLDRDGDGWGIQQGTALARCQPIPGRSANLGDCDDTLNSVHPTALENCNGIDDNCNGKTDEGTDYQCKLASAVGVCKQGACAVLSCFPGRDDCDKDASNGCECVVKIKSLASPPAPASCIIDMDCDDHDYCNGKEHCNPSDSLCYAGTPVNCGSSPSVLQGSFNISSSLDIQALAGIQTITGDLGIQAPGLQNLVGLESLTTIGGNLSVLSNTSLLALVGSGLINLTTVGGSIEIEDNPKLTTILFPNLVTADAINISRNAALVTLDHFDNLVAVRGTVTIGSNPALTSITAMPVLRSVGDLSITGNKLLATLSGLGSLAQVANSLYIEQNALTKIRLAGLSKVGGSIEFANSDTTDSIVTSIDLPMLNEVAQSLTIDSMHALKTLSVPALTKVCAISVMNNDLLVDPDLHALVQIGPDAVGQRQTYCQVNVSSNPSLTSVARVGTANISCPTMQCTGYINGNTSLLDCDAVAFANRLKKFSYVSWSNNKTPPPPDGGVQCPASGTVQPGIP
ncbi:MAG TPA: MopE-related protein [Polyangiales bacterium]